MNKAALSAFITEYGDRIFCINLDNSRFIYIGYNGGVKLSDISLNTIGGVDYISVAHTDKSFSGVEVKYTVHHLIDSIQWIGTLDEGYSSYGIDPLKLR